MLYYVHMKTSIKATNLSLTDSITSYIEKRFAALDRYIGHEEADTICHIEVARTTLHHKHGEIFKAEVRVIVRGTEVYVVRELADLYSAIDAVHDELMERLSATKDRRQTLWRKGAQQIKNMMKRIRP